MPCEMQYVHKPPSDTELKCSGDCDPIYQKTQQGKFVPVKPTCRQLVQVEWVLAAKKFNPKYQVCVCTVPAATDSPCHWEPEVDPQDTSTITKPRCLGGCSGPYYDDAQGTTQLKMECQYFENPTTRKIECVCVVIKS